MWFVYYFMILCLLLYDTLFLYNMVLTIYQPNPSHQSRLREDVFMIKRQHPVSLLFPYLHDKMTCILAAKRVDV